MSLLWFNDLYVAWFLYGLLKIFYRVNILARAWHAINQVAAAVTIATCAAKYTSDIKNPKKN